MTDRRSPQEAATGIQLHVEGTGKGGCIREGGGQAAAANPVLELRKQCRRLAVLGLFLQNGGVKEKLGYPVSLTRIRVVKTKDIKDVPALQQKKRAGPVTPFVRLCSHFHTHSRQEQNKTARLQVRPTGPTCRQRSWTSLSNQPRGNISSTDLRAYGVCQALRTMKYIEQKRIPAPREVTTGGVKRM